MDAVNLFEIGKAFYQRAFRDPENKLKQEAYTISRQLWESEKTREELLDIVAQLREIERGILGLQVSYANRADKAVKSGEYFVSIPHEISHRYNESSGRVYILTSMERPGQCKLGATTISMDQRCKAYHAKYGYRVQSSFAIDTKKPFSCEKWIAAQILHLRVAGNTKGDSNEWYKIDSEVLKKIIMRVVHELS